MLVHDGYNHYPISAKRIRYKAGDRVGCRLTYKLGTVLEQYTISPVARCVVKWDESYAEVHPNWALVRVAEAVEE
jgi:hypothetical protein